MHCAFALVLVLGLIVTRSREINRLRRGKLRGNVPAGTERTRTRTIFLSRSASAVLDIYGR